MTISTDQLRRIMPHVDVDKWLTPINCAMAEFDINTPARKAMFLAQVAHESVECRHVEEDLRYGVLALRRVWPKRFPSIEMAEDYAHKPEKIANYVYANRMGNGDEAGGDGWRYRGRGLIQLTGKENYRTFGAAIKRTEIVDTPDLVAEPALAAISAGWYWREHGLNHLADNNEFEAITRRINGGLNGLDSRQEYLSRAVAVL